MFCQKCGEKNKEHTNFCKHCGASLKEKGVIPQKTSTVHIEQKIPIEKKDTVGKSLSWIFGVLFGLGGLGGIASNSFSSGFILIIMSAVLLPPVNKMFKEKVNFEISKNLKITIIFIGFIVFGIFVNTDTTPHNAQTFNDIQTTTQAPNTETKLIEKEYINEDLYDLIYTYVVMDSELTDLQKEDQFNKNIKGKYFKSIDDGIVLEVTESFGTPVVRLMNPDNEFLTGATIYFKKSEKEKLLSLTKYSSISFEGIVSDFGSFMGIIIRDAELI